MRQFDPKSKRFSSRLWTFQWCKASTIRQIVEVWQRQRAPVVRLAVGVRHGHPVLFDRRCSTSCGRRRSTRARAVVHAHADRIVNVPVEDEGCLVDVDTPPTMTR